MVCDSTKTILARYLYCVPRWARKLIPLVMGHMICYYGAIWLYGLLWWKSALALCCSHRMDGSFSVMFAIPLNPTHGLFIVTNLILRNLLWTTRLTHPNSPVQIDFFPQVLNAALGHRWHWRQSWLRPLGGNSYVPEWSQTKTLLTYIKAARAHIEHVALGFGHVAKGAKSPLRSKGHCEHVGPHRQRIHDLVEGFVDHRHPGQLGRVEATENLLPDLWRHSLVNLVACLAF